MRGIILAGGTGSRLGDLTKVTNKHLLPVGGKPMIYWPLKVLHEAGITDITIVSTPRGVGQLAELLGGGYTYRVQDKPGGIAHAISCANISKRRSDGESIAVILGDNVFYPSPFLKPCPDNGCAVVFLKGVNPTRASEFGIPTFDEVGDITKIDEKPKIPSCNLAVTGLYLFGADVFERIADVTPSKRGEIEVTDLLNLYAERDTLAHYELLTTFWADAGTLAGMHELELGLAEAITKYNTNPTWPR